LKAYENDSNVHIKIEGSAAHPYVKTAYIISYHGICKTSKYGLNKQPAPKLNISPTLISEEALRNSISKKISEIKNQTLICDGDKLSFGDESIADMLKFSEIQITNLDKNLSLLDELNYYKIVKGNN
jgi:hypothetical protein